MLAGAATAACEISPVPSCGRYFDYGRPRDELSGCNGLGFADPLQGFAAYFADSAVYGDGDRDYEQGSDVVGESGRGDDFERRPLISPCNAHQSANCHRDGYQRGGYEQEGYG